MINKLILEKSLSEYFQTDHELIRDFFFYSDNKQSYNVRQQRDQKYGIKKVIQRYSIRDLNYELIMQAKQHWLYTNEYRKFSIRFLYYLCDKKIIPNCPLYHLLVIEDFIFSATPCSPCDLEYFITFDEKYFTLLLKSSILSIPHEQKLPFLFFHLDKSIVKDSSLFNALNNELEELKWNNHKYTTNSKLNLMQKCIVLIKDFIKYGNKKIDSVLLMELIEKWKNNVMLFDFLSIFDTHNYFKEPLISEVINLVHQYRKKSYKTTTTQIVKKIFESKNPKYWYPGIGTELVYYDCSDSYKLNCLREFAKVSKTNDPSYTFFLNHFDESLSSPHKPLSFYTYLEQIIYLGELANKKSLRFNRLLCTVIHSFYTFYQINYDSDVFSRDGYATALLSESNIAQKIFDGYDVINYNMINPIPKSDKWILCYKETKSSNIVRITKVDFTSIDNTYFRNWYKSYLWNSNRIKLVTLRQSTTIFNACNYINSIKTNKKLSYYVRRVNALDDINTQEIRALKSHIHSLYTKDNARVSVLSSFRSFIKYVNDNGIHKFEGGVFIELSRLSIRNVEYSAKPIPKQDLQLIIDKLHELETVSLKNKLYSILFYLALETEFRFNQLCDLKVDCVQKTVKENEYIIASETKTSNQAIIEQPITIYVKKCIDEVKEITKDYRLANTNKDLNELLFIIPGVKKGTYTRVDNIKYNKFLKEVCLTLNISPISVSNIRDTHMKFAEEHVIKEHLSDTQLSVLTSHSSTKTTILHYSKLDLIEMLEATNNVIIGDVNITGKIEKSVSSNLKRSENIVSDNCGYCSNDKCPVFSELSCLLCKSFVTTIDRKPYFEEQVKIIDNLIELKSLQHDKKDLVNRKRLLLKYIEAITSVEQGGHFEK